jgi:glycosyltransferase involved in cell wall biosynthesis
MFKIVLLSTSLGMGGADRQVIYLARALLAKGHQVQVISLTSLGQMGLEAQAKGLPIQSLNMARGVPDISSLVKLINLLKALQPQILTTFMFHANIMGRIAGFITKTPVIISSIRNENFGGQNRDLLIRVTNWIDDVCITNSQIVAHKLIQRQVVAPGKIKIITNGIAVERYHSKQYLKSETREKLGIPDTAFLWLAVGRLLEQKDYPNLLDAFSKIANPNVYLAIAGEGKLLSELQQKVQSLNITNQVFFLGVRPDIPELLAAADAFVLSSAWEGMPNVVMEALASATPVVATDVGGVRELVEDCKSGFVVPPCDALTLSEAMTQLVRLSNQQRQEMGKIGFDHIQFQYSVEKVTQDWEDLYKTHLSLVPSETIDHTNIKV